MPTKTRDNGVRLAAMQAPATRPNPNQPGQTQDRGPLPVIDPAGQR